VTDQPLVRTRDRILDAALDLFAEKGFAGTTISDIERRVGLASGTGSLHRHFRSKDEVLHAATEREVHRIMGDIAASRATAPLPEEQPERTRAEYERALSDIRRFDRVIRLVLSEGSRLPDLPRTVAKVFGSEGEAARVTGRRARLAVAALAGYHLLGQLEDGPFQGVSETDFVDYLVEVTRGAPD
jgi:AcrR family transcriptional regulator